ncbi:MAG TPA: hypothetical protein VGI75_06685 [Pirellulales bacterium]
MSLLLKALSRANQQEKAPAVETRSTTGEPPIPSVEPSISSDDLSEPTAQISIPPSDPSIEVYEPVDSLIDPPSPPLESSTQESSAALEAAADPSEDAAPTLEQPAVDQLAIDETLADQATVDQVSVDQTPVDLSVLDQLSAEIEAVQTPGMVLPSIETTLPPIEPPAPANELVPPPFETASEHETYGEFASEPIWQQLAELQNLVSSDLDRFKIDNLDSQQPYAPAIDVTITEELEIDAIDIDPPSITPLPVLKAPATISPPLPSVAPLAAALTPPVQLTPIAAIVPSSPAIGSPTAPTPALNIKPEFRELRDQLLSRLNISKHPTLLLIDAGQNIGDSSWLLPLAMSLVEKLNAASRDTPPQILIVEAAGSNCGIAQTLGLDAHLGLNHVLARRTDWQATVQSTPHPQIKLLGRGADQLRSSDFNRLAKCWAELSLRFDLILVAAGPVYEPSVADQNEKFPRSSANIFFPLATAAILCIELNGTPQAAALEAKRLLDARGIQVLGCIVQPA